ncbi:hypothetical protein Tco_1007241 [Tanacetum coccineum]
MFSTTVHEAIGEEAAGDAIGVETIRDAGETGKKPDDLSEDVSSMRFDVPRYLFLKGRASGDGDGDGVSYEDLYLLRNKDGDKAAASATLADMLGDRIG